MNINTKALKGVIEEIEASRARQKGEAEFQREAIKRAVKQHQLDGKAIRIVLQRRAMGDEKRDEQDYYVHAYEHALGGKKLAADALASGATIREAAAIGGISTGAAGNLAKVVQKSSKLDKPQDGDDGITESCGGVESRHAVEAGKTRDQRAATGAPELVGSAVPLDRVSAAGQMQSGVTVPTAGVAPGPHDTSITKAITACIDGNECLDVRCSLLGCGLKATEFEAPATPSVGAVASPEGERVATPFLGDDPGPPPEFLRRTPEQGRRGTGSPSAPHSSREQGGFEQ